LTATPYAFRGSGETGSPANVHITHLEIEHYAGSDANSYRAAVWLESASKGWVVDSNDIHANHWGSVGLGNHTTVIGNHFHGNAFVGYSSYGNDSTLFTNNEVDSNTVGGYSCAWSCGGGKMTKSQWARIQNNNFHHNLGKGIWMDADNRYCDISGNTINANTEHGVAYEINEDCAIHNNTITNGGTTHFTSGSGGGVVVASSQNVEIYSNTISNYGNGIAVRYDGSRGTSGWPGVGAWTVKHVHVHDNNISMNVSGSFIGGFDQSGAGVTFADSTDVTFRHNTYSLAGTANYFKWGGTQGNLLTDAAWKVAAKDTTSTYTRH